MNRRLRAASALAAVALLGFAPASRAEPVSVARLRYGTGRAPIARATLFFLELPESGRVVAVGTAHSFDLARLAEVGRVELIRGRSHELLAVASRMLVLPGRGFREPGGSLARDFVVFGLDAAPKGVRPLPPASAPVQVGQRVRILGVPSNIPSDEDDIFGRVRRVESGRLEIDLDVPEDLRGWGGAPVLEHPGGRVIGILEAAWPSEETLRLAAAPIAGVLKALTRPLGGGRGVAIAEAVAAAQRVGSAPAASAASGGRPAAAPSPSAGVAERAAAGPLRAAIEASRHPPASGPAKPSVDLEILFPPEGAVVGDPVGAFIAGRAIARRGDTRQFDVIFVLDTSGSTAAPSGADINRNGVIGKPVLGGLGSLLGSRSTDPGDSVLAAEVAAARHLLESLDPRVARVGLVTFAGEEPRGGRFGRRPPPPAFTEVPLTTDYRKVRRGLERVLERGPGGLTHMAAGVDQATIELLGLRGALSEPNPKSEKVVLFLTDGQPTLPYGPGFQGDNVKAVIRAAERARRAGIQVHTFAIGEEALEGPVALIELSDRTGGVFTPVREPAQLREVIEEVDLSEIAELVVRNTTTKQQASVVVRNPDGTFGAIVPLAPGRNRIEVRARANDGSEGRAEVEIAYAPSAPEARPPRELAALKTRVLERRLVDLRRENAEKVRRELQLEIDRERNRARERAERQRKELELEPEGLEGGNPGSR